MAGSILGTRVLRTEDPALLTGAARYLNDLDLPGKLHAVFARSEVAHATLGAVHIDDAAGHARRRRRVHRRRPRRRAAPRVRHGPPRLRPPAAGRRRRPLRRRGDRPRRRRDADGREPTAPPRCGPTTSRSTRSIDPEAALADDAAVIFPDHGTNQALVIDRRRAARPRRHQRRRRPRPLRQPAHGRRADGAQRLRGRSRRRRPADVLRLDPDAPRPARPARRGARHRRRPRCTSSPRRSAAAFGGKAGDLRRVLGGRRRGPPPRPPGHVDADAQRRPRLAPPQPRPDPVRRARLPPRRHVHRAARPPRRRRRRLPRHRRLPAGRHQADVQRHVPLPGHPVRRRRRRHQHHADGRLPRRRPARGDRAARAARRPRRPRAGHRPDRAAPPQPPRRRRLPVRHAHRAHLRQRPLHARRSTPPPRPIGYDELRARAGRRGGRAATAPPLGIGVAAYVEITAGGGASEFGAVEVHDDGSATVRAGTFAHGQGHQTAFAMLVNDQTGIPIDRIRLVDGDTDLVPHGRRHGRVAVAAARRLGRPPGHRGARRARPSASPPTCSRPTSPTSSSTPTPARSASPACRPAR